MSYIQKEGSGTLFKNDRKASETHADYTGTIMVNGKTHWFSGWVKEGTKGKFFSVAIGKEKVAMVQEKKTYQPTENLDDLPF